MGMFKNAKDTIKDNIKNIGDTSKALEGMNILHSEKATEQLINGEEIIQCYGLLADYICITNKRIFFVDGTLVNKTQQITSIPFRSVEAVHCDYGHLRGQVTIETKTNKHELKVGGQIAEAFAKQVLEMIL